MRIGLLARADNRGLATQSLEFFRHMAPARTVVVDMGALSPYPCRAASYPGAEVVAFTPHEPLPGPVRAMLGAVDVVFSAETFYWDDLVPEARASGVRTVCVANWEFFRWHTDPDLPRPDLFIAPSVWHLSEWPSGTVHLPFPVARDVLPFRLRRSARSFLHVAGHRAMRDRAGTRLVLAAARYVASDIDIVIRSQSPLPSYRNLRRVRVEVGDVDDYTSIYDGADVLVAPRRYGGLSLVLNEAQACGMPVIALHRVPESEILPAAGLVPARRSRSMRCQVGEIGWYDADPREVARRIDAFASSPETVRRCSERADAYARSISWATLAPRLHEVLGG